MARYFWRGLLIVAILGAGVTLFSYRTQAPPAVPVVDQLQTAEFGGVSLRLEYAITPEARERGLGGRTEIPRNYGMLFIFPKDDKYGFWMKDTLVPLDIFWLDAEGQAVSIAQDVMPSSYPNVFYPSASARYVLETAAGFARAHSIATGTPLRLKNFPTVSK